MNIAVKLGIIAVLGAGAIGVGGYYLLSNKETIGSILKDSIENYQKILFSKGDKEWEEWKEVYGSASSGTVDNVSKDELSEWCESILQRSNTDKNIYDFASKWCVVNTRTLREELASGGISLLEASDLDEKWQKAWDYLNSKKGQNPSLDISDASVSGSGVTAENGKKPLHDWCTIRYSLYMYSLKAISDSDKVRMWCSSAAGDFSTSKPVPVAVTKGSSGGWFSSWFSW